jgi:hypothetical protein
VLNINIPKHVDAAVSVEDFEGETGRTYMGFSAAQREKAGAELVAFLDKYRPALSMTQVSRRAGRPNIWAYNVEKTVRERGRICPDAAQAFVDAATSFLNERFAK